MRLQEDSRRKLTQLSQPATAYFDCVRQRQHCRSPSTAASTSGCHPTIPVAVWLIPLGPIPLWPIPLGPIPLGPIPLGPIPLWPIPLRRRCTQLLRRMSVSCVNTEVVLELVSQLRACTAKHAPLFEFLKVGRWALNGCGLS